MMTNLVKYSRHMSSTRTPSYKLTWTRFPQTKQLLNTILRDWVNLQQVGRLRHWRHAANLLSLTKDDRDAINVAKVKRNYTTFVARHRNTVGRKVRVENVDDARTADTTLTVRAASAASPTNNGKDNHDENESDDGRRRRRRRRYRRPRRRLRTRLRRRIRRWRR